MLLLVYFVGLLVILSHIGPVFPISAFIVEKGWEETIDFKDIFFF
jgi:hypothetical protein